MQRGLVRNQTEAMLDTLLIQESNSFQLHLPLNDHRKQEIKGAHYTFEKRFIYPQITKLKVINNGELLVKSWNTEIQ